VSAETHNYDLTSATPCAEAGLNQEWMNSAKDLAGRDRIFGATVDMGAYEPLLGGGTLYLFR
jgi:hypothetical protein